MCCSIINFVHISPAAAYGHLAVRCTVSRDTRLGLNGTMHGRMKEQLLSPNRFRTVEALNQALRDFAHRFNSHRIVGRIGYRTAAAHRRFLPGRPRARQLQLVSVTAGGTVGPSY